MICLFKVFILFMMSYFIGSFSFAIILSFVFKLPDPRSYGSSSAGATNVFRRNRYIALLTLVGDISKAYFVMQLPYIIDSYYKLPICPYDFAVLLFGVALGHIFPVFNSFRGGKGVACLIGAIIAFDPRIAAIGSLVMLVIVVVTRYSFLSTLSGLIVMGAFLLLYWGDNPIVLSYVCTFVLVLVKHFSNIARFFNGKENRLHF